MRMNKEITLEAAFEKLENAIEQLEQENISLEDSFKVFQEGMKMVQICNEKISKVDKAVLVLTENGELHEF